MMRRLFIVICVFVLLGIGGMMAWRLWPARRVFYTDADTIKAPKQAAMIRQILWQPPKYRPDLTHVLAADHVPFVAADGLTMLLAHHHDGDQADIYFSRKSADGWSEPIALAAVNSDGDDLGPVLSNDGRTIFFYSNRAGSVGGYDLWVAYRREGEAFEFNAPINPGTAVNSPFNEYGPALSPDGHTLYFSSNRPPPVDPAQPTAPATSVVPGEESFQRTYDLYVSAVTERSAEPARPLRALNTSANEGAPSVSPVGDFLYFASDRTGGHGGFDLYRSRRLHGAYEPAYNLGGTVNSVANDLDPSLDVGGYGLFFSSDRSLHASAAPDNHSSTYHLYHTRSREVFVDWETMRRGAIHWAAIWSAIWPNLLWLAIAATLSLLLIALMRRTGNRRLSLLTRCLLGSMLAHLVLVMLLTIWGVTSTLAGEYARRGKIQVALASPDSARDIAAQITGKLTAVAAPIAEPQVFDRAGVPHERTMVASEAKLDVSHPKITTDRSLDAGMTLADAEPQWQAKPGAWHPPSVLPPALVSVSVATPPDPLRITRREFVHATDPSETPVEGLQRPEVAVTIPPSLTPSVAEEPTFAPPVEHQSMLREGWTETLAAGENIPFTARVTPEPATPVPGDFPPTTRFPLALARSEKLPGVAEIQPDASGRTLAVPYLRATHRAGTDSASDVQIRLSPEARVPTPDVAGAFAKGQLARMEDSPPIRLAVLTPKVAIEVSPPDGVATRLSTPQEVTKVAYVIEKVSRVDPANRPEVVRAENLSVDSKSPPPHFDRMDPDRAAPVVGETSMASTLRDVASDHHVPFVPPKPPPAARVVSVWPERKAFELPKVEEVQIAPVLEPDGPVNRVVMAALRADVDSWQSQPLRVVRRPNVNVGLAREVIAAASDTSLIQTPTVPDEPVPVVPTAYAAMAPVDIPADLEHVTLGLELSPEESPPENAFLQRSAPNRMDIVKRMGGSEDTEAAVALALKWLARHQDGDGYWDVRVFDAQCGGCDHTPSQHANVVLTGLATLCFLGAGHTHDSGGRYEDTVNRAISWLRKQQASNGDLRGEETMYAQSVATIALSEALAMTGDERLREPVELALRFIYAALNRRDGGRQYHPRPSGDTAGMGWTMMALKSVSTAGLPVPSDAFDVGADWLELLSESDQEALPSMTAEAMFIQQLLGKTAADPTMQASADYISAHLPDWDRNPDTYFWYYASLALFQHQGPSWTAWNEALKHELVTNQRKDGQAAGSWDPQGNPRSERGGRVYQTALCTLMLEVYYRYLPLYSGGDPMIPDRPDDAFGTIAGVVRDADTGRPLTGATVRLDVPDGKPILAQTDRDGFYYLWTPELPPFFALSAAHEGYVPESVNVDSTALQERVLDVGFDLRSDRGEVFSTEAIPEVHHLGDNRFEGRINSQFQKRTEGAEYGSEFVITSEQLARRFRLAEVRLMAKGVQRRHSLFINGVLLDRKLDRAPRDGSFGEFRASFDPKILRAGTNTIDLIAKPSNTDIDDFEFVNVQIHLFP